MGTPITVTPGQMLSATGGATPVAFAQPAHGSLAYGPNGTMIYTPDPEFSGTDQFTVTTTDAVRRYAVDVPPIATFGDVEIGNSADGSSIAAVPGSADQIYGLTDRGPNVDGRTDDEKVLPVPDFQPRISKFTLSEGNATVEQTIGLTGTDGKPLNGLVDPQANTGEKMVDMAGNPLPTSDHGLDTEGLVAMPDGTFWVSDEYGPFVVHFDATGREIERLSPFDGTLPAELALRTPNRGMEGLTLTPDGSALVGIMQSALETPGLAGSPKAVPLVRMVVVNLATKDVAEYLYPLSDPDQTGVAVSEILALSNTTFLVDERDGEPEPGADKKIYLADISGATDIGPRTTVEGAIYDGSAGGLLIDGKPIETAVGVTTDAAAAEVLKDMGIVMATKTLKLDLGGLLTELNGNGEFFGSDKIEGLATWDGGKTLVISNDSDFGLAGLASKTPPFTLEPKILADGQQDFGQYLVVETAKLPAKTRTMTVSVTVG